MDDAFKYIVKWVMQYTEIFLLAQKLIYGRFNVGHQYLLLEMNPRIDMTVQNENLFCLILNSFIV